MHVKNPATYQKNMRTNAVCEGAVYVEIDSKCTYST